MPPAAYKAGPDLTIELDNVGPAHRPCQPGHVITGRVVRTAPGVSPHATVSIRLLGRAKTKIVVTRSNGQTTSHSNYRNRFNFFKEDHSRDCLFDGPLHIAPGATSSASWPFAIEVPLAPSPQALLSDSGTQETSYLSLSPGAVASSGLPASFATKGRHHNVKFEAYVEYQLEAMLLTLGSHRKSFTAVLPIQMSAPSMPHPITDFDIHRRSQQDSVSTFHLVPGMETAELTFKQKTKQVLGSSKVLRFGYTVHVDCPAVIQLENPAPIPFLVRIVPDSSRTSEIIQEVNQTVALHSLDFVLKAHTTTIAPTTFSSQTAHDTLKHSICLPVAALAQTMNPEVERNAPAADSKVEAQTPGSSQIQRQIVLILPSKWQAGDETVLNIGVALDFRLFPTHAMALGRKISMATGGAIVPGFETYCIRHNHTLKWKLSLGIAGKTVKHESEQTITILGPNDPPLPPPLAAVAQLHGRGFEELPAYGPSAQQASAQQGGPSNYNGCLDVPVEDLPPYAKQS